MSDVIHVQVPMRGRTHAARSQAYKVWSQLFVYPELASQQQFVCLDARILLDSVSDDLPYQLDDVESMPSVFTGADLKMAYTSLFDNCSGRSLVPLYEKDHVGEPAQSIWEDLIRFYEHFGIPYELGVNKEWPDWIGMELEFMHYLSFCEVAATDAAQASSLIAAQGDFIDRHLARWVPALCDALEKKGAATPYGAWAGALRAFLQSEQQFNQRRRPLARTQ